MQRDRNVLAQILKSWAQDHDHGYQINTPGVGDQGVDMTGAYLSWLIKETPANIDLMSLLDRLETYTANIRSRKHPDGMFCRKCQSFHQFAESNQEDGSFLCYSCRSNPYT